MSRTVSLPGKSRLKPAIPQASTVLPVPAGRLPRSSSPKPCRAPDAPAHLHHRLARAPGNPIVTRGVRYPARAVYGGRERPAIRFSHTEVYLNDVLTGKRTVLMGLKYRDAAGKLWEQGTAAWSMRAGKGTVLYFMAGHSAAEFEDPAYSRILVNAFAAR